MFPIPLTLQDAIIALVVLICIYLLNWLRKIGKERNVYKQLYLDEINKIPKKHEGNTYQEYYPD